MSQLVLLQKLKNNEITLEEFLYQSEDSTLDQYKMTKEEFLQAEKILDSTKEHELKHAKVYEKERIIPEFYFMGEHNRIAATSASKESLQKWLEGKNKYDYIELLKEVISAPGDDMSNSDRNLFDILNA